MPNHSQCSSTKPGPVPNSKSQWMLARKLGSLFPSPTSVPPNRCSFSSSDNCLYHLNLSKCLWMLPSQVKPPASLIHSRMFTPSNQDLVWKKIQFNDVPLKMLPNLHWLNILSSLPMVGKDHLVIRTWDNPLVSFLWSHRIAKLQPFSTHSPTA